MKKTFTLCSLAMAMMVSTSSFAWNKKNDSHLNYDTKAITGDKGMTEGGFFLHYTPYLPTGKYLFPKEVEVNGDVYDQSDSELTTVRDAGKFGFGHGLEIGNHFRLVDSEPIAIGLRVTWFNFGFTGFKASSNYSYVSGFSGQLSALKLGPYFTFALNDQMAVDAFYQVTPTLNFGVVAGTDPDSGEAYVLPLLGTGFTHQIGATFRFDILSVGVGYGMGNTSLNYSITDDNGDLVSGKAKMFGSHLRFMLGMKF